MFEKDKKRLERTCNAVDAILEANDVGAKIIGGRVQSNGVEFYDLDEEGMVGKTAEKAIQNILEADRVFSTPAGRIEVWGGKAK